MQSVFQQNSLETTPIQHAEHLQDLIGVDGLSVNRTDPRDTDLQSLTARTNHIVSEFRDKGHSEAINNTRLHVIQIVHHVQRFLCICKVL